MRATAARIFGFVLILVQAVCLTPSSLAQEAAGPPKIQFRVEPGRVEMAMLRKRFTEEQLLLLEKLNRSDRAHLPRMRALVIPGRWDLPETAYSPLPEIYPSARELPKSMVIHLPGQIFGAYEYGKLVRWGPVSSGVAHSPTPPGLYHLNWKSSGRHSTVDASWYMEWYFNFENQEGRALHAYALPGYPASHSCIRLLERDAMWVYEWGEEWSLDASKPWLVLQPGTPVFLAGEYDFQADYPWRSAEWLARKIELPAFPLE